MSGLQKFLFELGDPSSEIDILEKLGMSNSFQFTFIACRIRFSSYSQWIKPMVVLRNEDL
jgi:hypothetical protein